MSDYKYHQPYFNFNLNKFLNKNNKIIYTTSSYMTQFILKDIDYDLFWYDIKLFKFWYENNKIEEFIEKYKDVYTEPNNHLEMIKNSLIEKKELYKSFDYDFNAMINANSKQVVVCIPYPFYENFLINEFKFDKSYLICNNTVLFKTKNLIQKYFILDIDNENVKAKYIDYIDYN